MKKKETELKRNELKSIQLLELSSHLQCCVSSETILYTNKL